MLQWVASLPERYGRPRSSLTYIPQIDGLRALAIALVMVWHAGLRSVREIGDMNKGGSHFPTHYLDLPHGEIGVALFFVISGFVIGQPFLPRPVKDWRIGRFYWRRMHRIYPPFFVVLALGLATLILTGEGDGLHLHDRSSVPLGPSFVASALYLHGLIFDSSSRINPPIWSLEVEIQFYLISPLLLWAYVAIKERRHRLLLGLISAFLCLAVVASLHSVMPFDGRFRLGLPAHLHLFIIGIVLADAARGSDPLHKRGSFRFDLLFLVSLVALLATGLFLTRVDDRPPGGLPYLLAQLSLTLSTVGIYFGAMRGELSRRLLSWRWVCLTGTACYSIYLLHVGVIQIIDAKLLRHLNLHGSGETWFIGTPILLVSPWIVGLMFYCIVERRFMNRRLP